MVWFLRYACDRVCPRASVRGTAKKALPPKGREGLAARGTTLVKARPSGAVRFHSIRALTGASGRGYFGLAGSPRRLGEVFRPAARSRFAAPTGSLDAAIRWLLVPVIACFEKTRH